MMNVLPWGRRRGVPVGAAAGIAFLAAVVVLCLGGWQILRARDAILRTAEDNVRGLARSLAQHAARTLEAVDLTLEDAVEQTVRGADPATLSATLKRRAVLLEQIRNFVLIGPDGAWITDTAPGHGPLSSADRAYFRWHRDHAGPGLHVDEIITGRTSGKPGLPVSRRIDKADGGFGGVVMATLAPEYFERFYRTVRRGDQGTVTLWMDDGRPLLRYPPAPGSSPSENPKAVTVAAAAFKAQAGFQRSRSPFDGIERLFAFEHVENLPLVVSAAVSVDETLADWSQGALVEGGVIAAAAVALALLGFGFEARRRRILVLQDASREASRRYRLLAENSSDFITLKSSFTGPRSFVSPSTPLVVGWEPEEFATLTVERFVHPEDLDRVAAEFAALDPARPRLTSLHRVRHKAGHEVWLESVFRLLEDGTILIASRDVTERRAAEEALAESEARFRLLADASSDMIQLLGLDGRRRYVSPAAAEIFGRVPAEMAGTHPADFIHPEEAGRVRALIGDIAAGRQDRGRSLHRIRRADGHYVWVEVQFRLVRDRGTGTPFEIVSSVRDASERQALLERMEEANRWLRMAEEVAHVGHWRVELPGNVLTWSDEVYRIHGRDPAIFTPEVATAISLYHPDDRAEVARCVAEAIEARRTFDFALRILRPDGEVRHVISRGLVETGAGGEVTAIFGAIMDVTELRQAERERAEKSALLETTLENMDQGLVMIDPAGRVQVSNRRFCALLDLPPDLLAHNPAFEDVLAHLAAAGEFAGTDAAFQARIRDRGAPLTLGSYERSRPNGAVLEVRTKALPDGGIVRTYADITARRRAERAVAESEARYRLLADNSTDMITHMDLAGRRLFVSPASRELLGHAPEELVGTNPQSMVHPDDAAGLRRILDDLAADRKERAISINRLRHRDGRWIWVEASLTLLRGEDGRPAGFVAAVRNVMDRKLAVEALRESEARYRVLAETTSDVVTQLDLSMQRRYVSPACRQLLGYAPEELIGARPSARIHPEEAEGVRALAARLVAGEVAGDRVVTTYRTLHKEGHWVWVEALLNLLRDEETGAPLSIICSLRDVTERQRAARHLERAKAIAEQAARAKAEFLANMSHELRTPLTGILGVHDLLREDPSLNEGQRRLIGLAGEAGASLLAIVNDVLDFSKIEAGQMTIEAVPFDPRGLAQACLDLTARGIGGKPLTLRAVLPPDLPQRLCGDPTRLRQVLLNLLSNAVKFTEHGHVALAVAHRPDTGLLRVEVTDTGIGVPSDRLALLFDRFTQADTSMTRRYGGTGLGLAICKRLVALMGGRIGVEAGPEGGSRFWFELPASVVHAATADGEPGPAPESRPAAGRRLLLAEDNQINAEIIGAMLGARGYAVTVVGDGGAAVAAGAGFDLALIDLQMPVLDGLAATAEIRARERASGEKRLPIVGLTANALAEDVARCLDAGMDAHVAKPVVWPELFATIERLLGAEPASIGGEAREQGFEPARLAELAAIIGRDRLAAILTRFADDLPGRVAALDGAGAADIARQVHMLAAMAGQLGFRRLSDLCFQVEGEARAGVPPARIAELRAVAAGAVRLATASDYARVA